MYNEKEAFIKAARSNLAYWENKAKDLMADGHMATPELLECNEQIHRAAQTLAELTNNF